MFNLIVCINALGYIGINNKLMNYLPSDLKNFKKYTEGNVIIMGRKTYESLPNGALPNRINIVITTDRTFAPSNVYVAHSIQECVEMCRTYFGGKQLFIIGGATIYHQFLEQGLIQKMYITHTLDSKIGNVMFPIIKDEEWSKNEIKREIYDERDECDYCLMEYIKK